MLCSIFLLDATFQTTIDFGSFKSSNLWVKTFDAFERTNTPFLIILLCILMIYWIGKVNYILQTKYVLLIFWGEHCLIGRENREGH